MANFNNYLPQGASYELRSERIKSSNVSFENNRFERIDSNDRATQTVRLLHNGKLSTAASSKPNSAEELIKQASETVRYGSPHDVQFVGKSDVAKLNLVDDTQMSPKEMIEVIGEFVSELKKLDERLTVAASLTSTETEISLKTSNGFDHSYRKTVWSCGGSLALAQGQDLLRLLRSRVAMGPNFDLKKFKEDIAWTLENAKNTAAFKAGAYPVIFTPREMGNIINPIIASLNGQAIHRKVSPWSDKLGQVLLDERFTLIDDGGVDNSWTSRPFDLEGTPTKRNALVQNGRIQDVITDRKSAAQLGRESNGNAQAMNAAPNYLQIDAGGKSLDELIKSIDYGMIIDGTMGAWSGNPYTGIVTGTISMGLKIENGKIAGRVKDSMFTINAFNHLRDHLIDCSTEREQLPQRGAPGLFPYMLLDEVVISTK